MNRPQDRKRALTAESRCAECSGGEWWNSFETRCSPGTDLWSQFDFGVVYRDSPITLPPIRGLMPLSTASSASSSLGVSNCSRNL